jgi:uncharacterized protein YcbX
MSVIGEVHSLWRYPVKSMRGEELQEAFVGFHGIYGDRLFAFGSSASSKGVLYLTAREQKEMLLCRPRFRPADQATPSADPADLVLDVETPSGDVLAVDDPALIRRLGERIGDGQAVTLLRSDRAMTDCRPVSLFSVQTVNQIGDEIGASVDKLCFRANIYLDCESAAGFHEDTFVGQKLRIGSQATISVLERDPRCVMITLDPETGESDPRILRTVARAHDGKAGVYGAVLVEGTVRQGDAVEVVG